MPEEKVIEASKIADIYDEIKNFKNGYKTIVGEKGTTLSGGQKQRLAIARALIRHPDLYLFDDSFSALDFKTEAALRAALREGYADTTTITIAQRISAVMQCDLILVMEDGVP